MKRKCCRYCAKHPNTIGQKLVHAQFYKGLHIRWLTKTQEDLRKRTKNIQCFLTMEDIYQKLVEQDFKCAFTGIPLNVMYVYKEDSNASIDRIDSNGDYTKDNIQFIYKPLNWVKGPLNDNLFIHLCHLVASYRKDTLDFKLPKHFQLGYREDNNPINQNLIENDEIIDYENDPCVSKIYYDPLANNGAAI